MVKEFKLPDVGEGLTEADIVAWHVKPGDLVEDGQIIVEIETAKAVVELPCPWDGTVTRLLAEEGQTVEVGVPIIAVEVGTSDSAERAPVSATAPAESTPEDDAPADDAGAHSVLVGYGVKASSTTRRTRVAIWGSVVFSSSSCACPFRAASGLRISCASTADISPRVAMCFF